jgi:hypothetical protein
MNFVALSRSGVAQIFVGVATLRDSESDLNAEEKLRGGVVMKRLGFIWDTGATQTTIAKKTLMGELGYTEEYIAKSKVLLPDNEKPLLADGTKADLYKIPATRMNIGDYELELDYILTSDTINNLNSLLGMSALQYFKFTYDFDAINEEAEYGRLFYELRSSRIKPYSKMGEPFAYRLGE